MSHSIDECYAVYDETIRRARKDHACSACGLTIRSGDLYCQVFWVFDGAAGSVKRCGRCQKMHEHLRIKGGGEMWPDERLGCGLDYEEEWGREPPEEIQALPFLPADEASRTLSEEHARQAEMAAQRRAMRKALAKAKGRANA